MARYLLTGAAGFIGARVAEMLLEGGSEVVGVDNLNAAYDVRMKDHRLGRLQGRPGFTFRKLDICDLEALHGVAAGLAFDGVVHLAARAGVRSSLEDPWAYVETNVRGTLNLLELCRRSGVTKFLLASTSSIYGANPPLPTREEADSSRPLQPYAATKKAAEALCHSYHYLYGLDVTVLRYFTVYGPAGRPDMSMFRFTQWISEGRPVLLNGDGEQSRGFTYVDDIARGTILGLRPIGFEILNLGGHQAVKVNDLVGMLEKAIGRPAKIERRPAHPADMQASWASTDKAERLLGWKPRVPMEEGVGSVVAWYLKERVWAREIATD